MGRNAGRKSTLHVPYPVGRAPVAARVACSVNLPESQMPDLQRSQRE